MIDRPALPSYGDDENKFFHPPLVWSLEQAIKTRGLERVIIIDRQYASKSGPVDIVLKRAADGKVLVPIEVKKTQADVRGKGRRQAKDYRDNIPNRATDFYVSTNLELVEIFKWNATRSTTASQLLQTEFSSVGSLSLAEDEFYGKLVLAAGEIIDIVCESKAVDYLDGLFELEVALMDKVWNPSGWHSHLMPLSFDFIRSVAKNHGFPQVASSWSSSLKYRGAPHQLMSIGTSLNFDQVFTPPLPDANDDRAFSPTLLQSVRSQAVNAGPVEALSSLITETISKRMPGRGIVETDPDLARLLAVGARSVLDRDLQPGEKLLDPAAGNGRLLVEALKHGFEDLQPDQLMAVEKYPQFGEILSLTLGLVRPQLTSKENSPDVRISSFHEVPSDDLVDVAAVVVNPPYQSRARSGASLNTFEFEEFENTITDIRGRPSVFERGQAPFEWLYLDLLCSKVSTGTVVAAIVPHRQLFGFGPDGSTFRRFLLYRFGLTQVLSYPRYDLFQDLSVDTVIIIGVVGEPATSVEFIHIDVPVSSVDLNAFLLKDNSDEFWSSHVVLSKDLANDSVSGWGSCTPVGKKTSTFLDSIVARDRKLRSLGYVVTRGKFGGSGGNDFTVIPREPDRRTAAQGQINENALRPLLNSGSPSKDLVSNPPSTLTPFIDTGIVSAHGWLAPAISEYLNGHELKSGKQVKKVKTNADMVHIVSKTEIIDKDAIVVPRASRPVGHVALFEPQVPEHGLAVSTNYLVIEVSDKRERRLLASWFSSVFGQLQMEILSKPHNGLRKLEIGAFSEMRIPDLDTITEESFLKLESAWDAEEPIVFEQPVHRATDSLWAQILRPSDSDHLLFEAFNLLGEYVSFRSPALA